MSRLSELESKQRWNRSARGKAMKALWEAANIERVRESKRRWVLRNRRKNEESKKRYRERTKEKASISAAAWRKANPGRQLAKARLRKYGITQEEFDKLSQRQKHRCAVCRSKPKILYVDHCHRTRRVRGLLCFGCNVGLGHFRDRVQFLENAVLYLKGSR